MNPASTGVAGDRWCTALDCDREDNHAASECGVPQPKPIGQRIAERREERGLPPLESAIPQDKYRFFRVEQVGDVSVNRNACPFGDDNNPTTMQAVMNMVEAGLAPGTYLVADVIRTKSGEVCWLDGSDCTTEITLESTGVMLVIRWDSAHLLSFNTSTRKWTLETIPMEDR